MITLVVYADLPRLTSVDDCILSDDMPPDMTRILPYAMFSVRPETSSDQNPSCTQREEVETDLFFIVNTCREAQREPYRLTLQFSDEQDHQQESA